MDVLFTPPATHTEVAAIYPGAQIISCRTRHAGLRLPPKQPSCASSCPQCWAALATQSWPVPWPQPGPILMRHSCRFVLWPTSDDESGRQTDGPATGPHAESRAKRRQGSHVRPICLASDGSSRDYDNLVFAITDEVDDGETSMR